MTVGDVRMTPLERVIHFIHHYKSQAAAEKKEDRSAHTGRGGNEVFEESRRYALQYHIYASQYIQRVRQVRSFLELQQLGNILKPNSLKPQTPQIEIERINQYMTGYWTRAQCEVSERFHQLSGTLAHGLNVRVLLILGTPVGYLTNQQTDAHFVELHEQCICLKIPGTNYPIQLAVRFQGTSEEEAERFAEVLRSTSSFFDLPPNVVRAMDQRLGR